METSDTVDDLLRIAKSIGYGEIPPYQQCERYTAGAFDLITFSGDDRGEKFDLLGLLCGQYGRIKCDKKHLKGYFYLLTQLAYATDTTQRPEGMQKIINENQKDTEELRIWYRENC